VPHDPETRESRKAPLEFAERQPVPLAQSVQEPPPPGLGQGPEDGIERIGRWMLLHT